MFVEIQASQVRWTLESLEVLERLDRNAHALAAGFADMEEEASRTAPVRLVDISSQCNASLLKGWHASDGAEPSLESLPLGVHYLGGMTWNISGIIQLDSLQLNQTAPGYPSTVAGIALGHSCEKVHLLLGTLGEDLDGTTIARFVFRFANGDVTEVPIIYGHHVRNWQNPEDVPGNTVQGAFAVQPGAQEDGQIVFVPGARLYRMTWSNPRPHQALAAVDFVSAMRTAAAFLVAITLEYSIR